MKRRNFCKLAVLSSAGVGGMLLNANLTLARGHPLRGLYRQGNG